MVTAAPLAAKAAPSRFPIHTFLSRSPCGASAGKALAPADEWEGTEPGPGHTTRPLAFDRVYITQSFRSCTDLYGASAVTFFLNNQTR